MRFYQVFALWVGTVVGISACVREQRPAETPLPAIHRADFLVKQLGRVLWGQYMAEECKPVSMPGWTGMQTQSCTYTSYSGYGRLKVVLLNAEPELMAKWLATACADARAKHPLHCAERLALRIKCQSGNQFPIAGLVDEGRLYVFRDGVTVKLREFRDLTLSRRPSDEEQFLALVSGTVEEVKAFARIQGTTRKQYSDFTGIAESKLVGLQWQNEIRGAYKRAWGSDRNELLSAWAVANVALIDHQLEPSAKFDNYCKLVAQRWVRWDI